MEGAIVEVGVAAGGTRAFSYNFLQEIGVQKSYVCVDTFAGFVKEHFAEDVKRGNSWTKYEQFSANSISLVQRVLKIHKAQKIHLIHADISTIQAGKLPEKLAPAF